MAKIVLFGATGFTGKLTARALVARGERPVLAGRSEAKLRALATELGVELPTRVATSDDPASVAALVEAGDVLLTTVGPFVKHGAAALDAAIQKRAHYIDSTGEPGFIRRVFSEAHARALSSGSLLLTAFGYDYVPGHLAAGLVLERAGERATRVDVGYFSRDNEASRGPSGSRRGSERGYSQGTERSSRLAALYPGCELRGGKLVEEYNAQRVREFDLPEGGTSRSRAAFSLCASEHFALPRSYPQLRDVNTYLGWFGKRSYAMSRGARLLAAVRKIPVLSKLAELALSLGPDSHGEGPSAETRKRTGSQIVALAYDASGSELARVDLIGANAYDFTADILAWGAAQLVAGKSQARGARGPVEAFGLEALRDGCAQAGLAAR